MRIKRITYLSVMAAAVIGASCTMLSVRAEAGTSSAENAIRAAAKQNRYVVVTFYLNNDSVSKAMQAVVKSIRGKFANRADFVSVNVEDKANRNIISRFGVDRSPIPITIVVAPNGAITAGFPRELKKNNFSDVFVSDGTAAVLKIMQDSKIAAVCIQSSKTKHNKECLATAREVKSDSRFGGAVEVLTIDPSDKSESKLLKQWGVNDSANAQLVVIAPPGKVVGKFDGAATKLNVMANLTRALAGGCGGGTCAPGGCR